MNDDFLTRFRKPPSREFAAKLYQRIHTPMNTRRNFVFRRLTLAAALCAAFIAAFTFSPAARAALDNLFRQVGDVTYIGPEFNDPPLAESQVILVPEERLPLDQARTRVPFDILLPGWMPEGYAMSQTVRISYFPYKPTNGNNPFTYITWVRSTGGGGNIELAVSLPVNWLIDLDHVEEVEVNGQPAGLTGGSWNHDTGDWDTTYGDLTLTWTVDDVMYRLTSSSVTPEDLIRIADSIR
jgi:hypothetical protein